MMIRLLVIVYLVMNSLPLLFLTAEDIATDNTPPASLSASLDRKSARVGDTVILTIKYTLPPESKLISESEIDELDEYTIIDRNMIEGGVALKILIDRAESFEIGPFSLTFEDKEGEKNIITGDPVSLEVLSNLGERPADAQLKSLIGIMPITPLWLKYLPWIIGITIVLIAAIGIILWRRMRQRGIDEIIDQRTPDVIARDEIRKLQAEKLFEKGHYKEFYFRFSEILRYYLEGLRGFPAVEFTTEEIARRVKRDRDKQIIPLLREADLVKFADVIPTQDRKDEDIKTALAYIRDTSPTPSVAQHDNENAGLAK
ncbi:MAG: hypothetical protein SVZ03_02405 [Spirochaetota bacterium]|nr:hypothetical protein [Spirochaetota bacterium]